MFMHYAERYCTLRCGRKAINVLLSFCSCWVLADGEHCFLIIIIVIFFLNLERWHVTVSLSKPDI